MKKTTKIIFNIVVYLFAAVGFVLTGGFFAIRWHITDTAGNVDTHNNYFNSTYESQKKMKN